MNGNGAGEQVELAAPAKLNLALRVGPRRPDGFHEIASLLLPVTLSDRVTVTPAPGAGISVECAVAPGEQNLAFAALRELEARLGRTLDLAVTIVKQVPHGAGLGGGSSDAAAALLGADRLLDLDLSPRLLYEVALAAGSDVPFFLFPGAQLAMGRGQVLKAVELPALHLVVAVPELSLSTRAVYGWRDEDAEVQLVDWVPVARGLSARVQAVRTVRDVAALVANDLEASVVARRPQVGELIDALREQGALAAAMTGSGAAVFGLFRGETEALRARAALAPARAWYVTDLQPGPLKGGGPDPAPGTGREMPARGAPARRKPPARRRPGQRPRRPKA